MAKGGHRYPLVVYTLMIDRWRPAIFALGLAVLGTAFALYRLESETWRWLAVSSLGGFLIFVGIALTLFRKSAYIQPFHDHIRLATPFLRLNISYKRIRRASSANMGTLFPKNNVSNWQAEIIEPIAKMTVLVIEMTSFSMSQAQLRLFLSPLFFKDKTPHFVIAVDDWMKLSTEMESMRTGAVTSAPQKKQDSSILSRLPRNK